MTATVLKVLLICDSAGDIRLIRKLFKDNQIANCLDVIQDGSTVLDYLRDDFTYPAFVRPDIILIDTALPAKSGFQILREIKADLCLSSIPIVILFASEAEKVITENLQVAADYYVRLPLTLNSLLNALGLIFLDSPNGPVFAST